MTSSVNGSITRNRRILDVFKCITSRGMGLVTLLSTSISPSLPSRKDLAQAYSTGDRSCSTLMPPRDPISRGLTTTNRLDADLSNGYSEVIFRRKSPTDPSVMILMNQCPALGTSSNLLLDPWKDEDTKYCRLTV